MFKITTVRKLIFSKKGKKLLKILIFLLVISLLYGGRSLIFAAWVGNKPIFRYTLIKELEKQGGKQVLDALTERSLIQQEGSKANIKVSADDINKEMARIEEVVKKQGTTLDSALSLSGMTKKDLISQIRIQIIKERILKGKINVSDEEIKSYYDTNKIQESFETVKENIKNEIINLKTQEEYGKWIEEIKAKAKIFYFIKY